MNTLKGMIITLIFAVAVSGCINVRPVPGYAKSNELVHILLGGIKRNINGDALTKADLLATITDADGITFDVRVAEIYRSYPDYSSEMSVRNLNRSNEVYGHTLPYDGGWWVTLQLASLSTQQASSSPLPLAVGPATIAITSPTGKLIQTDSAYEGSYDNFAIEILEGVADTGQYDDRQYVAYSPMESLTIKPSDLGGVSYVGGVQFKVDYITANLDSATEVAPLIVPASHDPNINMLQRTVDNQDGTTSIIVMVTNPKGFVPVDSWTIGQSNLADLNFILVTDRAESFQNWQATFSIDSTQSYYIDVNGDEIMGVEPELVHYSKFGNP